MVPFTIINFNGLENKIVIRLRDVLGYTHDLTVDAFGFAEYQLGKHIQEALPNLTAAERELIMTGIPESVWNDMFDEDE